MIEQDAFSFSVANNTEVLRITRAGRFFVNQKEVETSEEIRDIFVEWCKVMIAEHNDLRLEDREQVNL